MHSNPSLRTVLNVAFEINSNVSVIGDGPISPFQGNSLTPACFYRSSTTSLLRLLLLLLLLLFDLPLSSVQAIDGVTFFGSVPASSLAKLG